MNKDIFKKYNKCIYCGSRTLKKEKNQFFPKNFYLKAIKHDLKLSKKQFEEMKVFKCNKCYILQNNPWFTEDISQKIYSNIYGQHNRSWSNLLSFLKQGTAPDHGSLFNLLTKKIKVENYAEFNSPFMGIFINFFIYEYKKNKLFYKNLSKNIFDYLTSRQVAGKSRNYQKLSFKKSIKFFNNILLLKKKNLIKKKINKFLFVDNSNLSWGQNDNYKSVNSKSFASEFFDLKILNLDSRNKKIDLFGIFHTLDHTFQPKKILDFALNSSKFVIVYCHTNKKLNKQHLFTFTSDFLKYLKSKKIYTCDLTLKIKKNYKSQEMYFLCSKQKEYISNLKF